MNINLLVIKANQPDALVAFYEQIGFQFKQHRHGNGPLHFAAEQPGFVFEIYPLPKGITTPDNTTRLGFTVPNLDTTLDRLKMHGSKVNKEPTVTEWGYQAVVEDPDGRKIELKEENTSSGKFIIEDKFKITGRGLVMVGIISDGVVSSGDELIFMANGVIRRRLIVGVDGMRITPMPDPPKMGMLIKCINEEEIDELRNWGEKNQLALIKNNNARPNT